MKGALRLDVVIRKSPPILELFPGEDQGCPDRNAETLCVVSGVVHLASCRVGAANTGAGSAG